ncbi:hypothetical protein [Pseudoalteromonas obscura]|uniref:CD-NTase-associated protein 15 domain-containing protein n=1 Tax=Pseudoalteromonas obscura TaxID=3048491 RepID=A0ABT7ETD0_9GAMM|nr:hypothetical protein [Pseudoalteromonas sp. P94(2023)]MDK2598316.1 hypothetical protein [Pseudoalteromonas sp. P94(2023)]
MIQYSIDTNEREGVYVVLALISVSLVSVLREFFEIFGLNEYAAPSAMVIFLGLAKLYDMFFWKLLSKLGLSAIPDINGTWEGELEKNNGQRFPVSMEVTQTWRTMQVSMDTETTTGSLQVANISISNKNRPIAKWIYNLRPRNFALKEGYNPSGEGVNEFRIMKKGTDIVLDGSYYSSQFRGGKVILSRPVSDV